MFHAKYFLVLVGAYLVLNCGFQQVAGGSGAGNPPLATVALAVKANSISKTGLMKTLIGSIRNPDGTFTIKDSVGNNVTLRKIEALVEGIDFTLPIAIHCDNFRVSECMDGEFFVPGPFIIDLLTGKSQPTLAKIKIPPGVYKKIGFELIKSDTDTQGAYIPTLQNIIIRGKIGADSGIGRMFKIALNLRDGLDFLDSTGIKLRTDTVNTVFLGLVVDKWLQGTDLRKCVDSAVVTDTGGAALLEGDNFCLGLGKRIRQNIEFSGGLDTTEEF